MSSRIYSFCLVKSYKYYIDWLSRPIISQRNGISNDLASDCSRPTVCFCSVLYNAVVVLTFWHFPVWYQSNVSVYWTVEPHPIRSCAKRRYLIVFQDFENIYISSQLISLYCAELCRWFIEAYNMSISYSFYWSLLNQCIISINE